MQALRTIHTVQNNQIIINLPESFQHKSVEVIVLPIYEYNAFAQENPKANKNERLAKLLSLSVWNETDIERIYQSQTLMNQWKIEEF